jgi:hypothetical protein
VRKPSPYCRTAGNAAITIFNTMKTAMSKANHAKPWHRARNAVSVTIWMRDGGLEIWLSAGTIQSLLFAGYRASLVLPDVAEAPVR